MDWVRPLKVEEPVADNIFRLCKVCNQSKQLNVEFNYHSTHDTYSHCCKDCSNRRRRIKYSGGSEPDEYKALTRVIKQKKIFENKPWRKTKYSNRKRLDYRNVDKKKGLFNNLTIEFIEKSFNSSCVYCGYPAITLDRINNNLGHTIENCVPACYECNICRNRIFSYEEMLIIGKSIKEIKDNRIGYDFSKPVFPRYKNK